MPEAVHCFFPSTSSRAYTAACDRACRKEGNGVTKLEQLAEEVAALSADEQKLLFARVADLAWRRGLRELSEMYKCRLASEGRLSDPPEKVMEELRRIREEVASREYPD
jgi:hypothetical protein